MPREMTNSAVQLKAIAPIIAAPAKIDVRSP